MTLTDLRGIRERCGHIGMCAYLVWRFGHRYSGKNSSLRFIYQVLDFVVVRSWANARIPAEVHIGERVGFVHDAQGVIINPGVVIGDDVVIFHQVTLGVGSIPGVPIIGNGVRIGAGAKVLGGVTLGDRAKVGANAVVVSDVREGATVVGAPAREVRRKSPMPEEISDETGSSPGLPLPGLKRPRSNID